MYFKGVDNNVFNKVIMSLKIQGNLEAFYALDPKDVLHLYIVCVLY